MIHVHILRPLATTTAREREQIAALDRYERRYLAMRECAWCDQPMDRPGCGAIYEACPEQVRINRRKRCLDEYQPRLNRRKR